MTTRGIKLLIPVALIAALSWWLLLPNEKSPAGTELPSPSEKRQKPENSPLILGEGSIEQDELSEADVDRILEILEPAKPGNGMEYDMSALLLSGETLVTEAYEALPGEFVVSFVTPEVEIQDGKQVLRIGLSSNRINISGETARISPNSNTVFEWPIGKRLNHSFIENEGVYSLQITATDVESGLIELNVRGGFRNPSSQ